MGPNKDKTKMQDQETASSTISQFCPAEENYASSESEKWDTLYELLKKDSPYLPADCQGTTIAKDIPWVQPKLLEDGRKLIQENYFFLASAHLSALLFVFIMKPICVVMLRTGKFHKADSSTFLKIVSTGVRILSWYEDDILVENCNAFKSIQFARRMHLGASRWREKGKPLPQKEDMTIDEDDKALIKAIKEDLEFIDTKDAPQHLLGWDPTVEFSQWDNVLVHWILFDWPIMFAKFFGIGDTDSFDGFRHIWAIFGNLLGIEDQFNLALHYHHETSSKLLNNIIVASLKDIDSTVVCTLKCVAKTFTDKLPIIKLKTIIYGSLKFILTDYKGNNLYAIMTWDEKILIAFAQLLLTIVTRFSAMRLLANWGVRYFINYHVRKHLPKLVNKK